MLIVVFNLIAALKNCFSTTIIMIELVYVLYIWHRHLQGIILVVSNKESFTPCFKIPICKNPLVLLPPSPRYYRLFCFLLYDLCLTVKIFSSKCWKCFAINAQSNSHSGAYNHSPAVCQPTS